jgi:DNA-binding protein HU-beta
MNFSQMDQIATTALATNQPKKLVKEIYKVLFDAIATAVAGGHRVTIDGLCVIQAVPRKARKTYNPRSGKTMLMPATIRPKFTPAKKLRLALEPGLMEIPKEVAGLEKFEKRPMPKMPKPKRSSKAAKE